MHHCDWLMDDENMTFDVFVDCAVISSRGTTHATHKNGGGADAGALLPPCPCWFIDMLSTMISTIIIFLCVEIKVKAAEMAPNQSERASEGVLVPMLRSFLRKRRSSFYLCLLSVHPFMSSRLPHSVLLIL